MIYFVQSAASDLIKIGFTGRAHQRFKSLRATEKAEIMVLGIMAGDKADEKKLHARFADFRVRGEWFSKCVAIEMFIANHTSPEVPADAPHPVRRLSVTISDEVAEAIKLLQAAEVRTESNMVALLLMEALAHRELEAEAAK